jgi:hypothetical protein
MKEIKFIIAKKNGRLLRFKSIWLYHTTIARDNNIDYYNEVIESGIIQDNKIILVTCKDKKHIIKAENKSIANKLNRDYLKIREASTRYDYNKRLSPILREGD